MKYLVSKSMCMDFAHIVSGHSGACINIHGHTWMFEVTLGADRLDSTGFVVDFKFIKQAILQPIHDLLDHSLLLPEQIIKDCNQALLFLGDRIMQTREATDLQSTRTWRGGPEVMGITMVNIGGLKLGSANFNPTSERLAQWLADISRAALLQARIHDRVELVRARVYETLHPVQTYADYYPAGQPSPASGQCGTIQRGPDQKLEQRL